VPENKEGAKRHFRMSRRKSSQPVVVVFDAKSEGAVVGGLVLKAKLDGVEVAVPPRREVGRFEPKRPPAVEVEGFEKSPPEADEAGAKADEDVGVENKPPDVLPLGVPNAKEVAAGAGVNITF
jgi:hypothetical protein